MSRLVHVARDLLQGFPRVSGDEPGTFFAEPLAKTFSPRERG